MKRLGVDLFREWFLCREGYLIDDEASFALRIEASAIDVMLRHVDWRWDKVDVPWLKRVLQVDWVPFDRLW